MVRPDDDECDIDDDDIAEGEGGGRIAEWRAARPPCRSAWARIERKTVASAAAAEGRRWPRWTFPTPMPMRTTSAVVAAAPAVWRTVSPRK